MTFNKQWWPQHISLKAAAIIVSLFPSAIYAQDQQDTAPTLSAPQTYPINAESADAWGFNNSDLAPDNRTLFGILPNGMRYAIRRNETPKETVAMRLVFSVGSLAETDEQRGIAHFLEHMAFNGSTNVPEGEMIKILERSGLAFGADTNAYTNFETTGYTLDLPNNKQSLINTAFFLLRETASEITLAPDAVERERGVVLSEMRTRDNFGLENFVKQTRFLLPDAIIADRLPIGTKQVLEKITSQDLRVFYEKYYTPDRATFVIVGDVDVAAIEKQIKATFGNWPSSAPDGAGPSGQSPDNAQDIGSVEFERTGENDLFLNPAIGESASFIAFRPYEEKPDSYANRKEGFLRNIGYRIINRRIGRLLRAGDAPFLGINIGSDDVFELARQTSFIVSARDGELANAIPAANNVIREALEFGFTQAELNEQIANYRTGFTNAVKSAETRTNGRLASLIISSALNDNIMTSPQDRLARFETIAAIISPQNIFEAIRNDLADLSDPLLYVTAKQEPAGGLDAIRKSYIASLQTALSKPETVAAIDFAYDDFGDAGDVVKDTRIDDLDIRTVTFANNVRLNIKKTDFEDDRVRISLRVNGGSILNTREEPNLTTLMEIFSSGGLGKHSVDELLTILAGRSVSIAFGAGTDYFGSYLATTPQDSLLQFQLLAAYLVDPGYRQEALDRYRQGFDNYYARLKATPGAALSSEIGAILSDNDPRFSLSEKEELEALEFADLAAAIQDNLSNGSIEIGVVGAVDEDNIIRQVASTFGALAEREASPRDFTSLAKRDFTSKRGRVRIYHEGEEEQAILRFYWPTTDDGDYEEAIALRLLSQVIQLRLTDIIREELGASYSPSAGSFTSSIYPDYGYFSIGSNVDYAERAKVSRAITDIVRGFASNPVTKDELLRARKPILERIRLRQTNNGSWLSIVDEAQSDKRALKRYREAESVLKSTSADNIMIMAERYLQSEPLIIETLHSRYDVSAE
jgi:zinc protease